MDASSTAMSVSRAWLADNRLPTWVAVTPLYVHQLVGVVICRSSAGPVAALAGPAPIATTTASCATTPRASSNALNLRDMPANRRPDFRRRIPTPTCEFRALSAAQQHSNDLRPGNWYRFGPKGSLSSLTSPFSSETRPGSGRWWELPFLRSPGRDHLLVPG